MRLLHRKSRLQRLLDTVEEMLGDPGKLGLPHVAPDNGLRVRLPGGKALQASLDQNTAVKAGMIASGLAGLTAGSAGISALRRRTQGAGDDS